MKNHKILLLIVIILGSSVCNTGCRNYREVDELLIVVGVAIDKGSKEKYKITTEVAEIEGIREVKTSPRLLSAEGKNMFDAVRNILSTAEQKLYWGHTKVLVISKELAKEGIIKVIDWYNRDAETRPDVHFLVSKANTAAEIFKAQDTRKELISFRLEDIIHNQASLGKAPIMDILQIDNDLIGEGLSATAPTVEVVQVDGSVGPSVLGTAIFSGDRLAGFLDGEETNDLLFIKNQIKGGVLVEELLGDQSNISVALEIFKSNTKVKPVFDRIGLRMDLDVTVTAAIDEIGGTEDLIEEEKRKKLEKTAEAALVKRLVELVKKVQEEYALDIFGFGSKLRQSNPKEWNRVSKNWKEEFKKLRVNGTATVKIRNSAMLSKPLEVSE